MLKQLLSPIKCHGGSRYKVKKIIPVIEWAPVYVEMCLGGGNILLNSPDFTSSGVSIKKYGFDLNKGLIRTWKVIRDNPTELLRILRGISYDKENFTVACKYIKDYEDVYSLEPWQYPYFAAMFLVKNRFSRAADGKSFGWSDRLRCGKPEYISAWETMIESLPEVSRKIRNVILSSGDCCQLIDVFGLYGNNICYYCDPPFYPDTRVSPKAYGQYDMMAQGSVNCRTTHQSLLDFIKNKSNGVTYLSGYNNPFYEKELGSPSFKWKMANSQSSQKKKPIMEECLWVINNSGVSLEGNNHEK